MESSPDHDLGVLRQKLLGELHRVARELQFLQRNYERNLGIDLKQLDKLTDTEILIHPAVQQEVTSTRLHRITDPNRVNSIGQLRD